VGLLFVDFDTGTTLQLTGRARILWEPEALARLEGAPRARGGGRRHRRDRGAGTARLALRRVLALQPALKARARYGLSEVLESSEVEEEFGLTRHSMATIRELADGSDIEAVTAGSHDGCSLNRFRRSSDESP
jgi:hypothetical protein